MNKPELMAPAGSFESLHAAINAGADSVFFGIGDFNMRATAAANFGKDDLKEIVELVHSKNVKAYLTLNTVLYDEEIVNMKRILDEAKSTKVDAVIAADMSTIMYANEIGLPVHISTQLSVSNYDTVKYYSKFAECVVLARELTLEQAKKIISKINEEKLKGKSGAKMKIEMFVHGAMCVAVSGRCAMSLHCYEKSANRGECTQICRRPYKVTDLSSGKELVVDNNYIMSASDMSTIGMIPELIDAGISIFKFEGRGRSPEYVDTVIRTYREAIESAIEGTYTEEKVARWNETLGTVFNRGSNTGFFMGRKADEWANGHGSKATEERTHIGKVLKYYPKINVVEMEVLAKETIKTGEKFSIVGKNTGTIIGKINELHLDEKIVKEAKQGDIITFKLDNVENIDIKKVKPKEKDEFFVIRKRESRYPRGREKLVKSEERKLKS